MSYHDWPSSELPREKLLNDGPEALTNAELIAIIINCGIKGKTAVDLAREMLGEYNSLSQLVHCDKHWFLQRPGFGIVKYTKLQAAFELGKRCQQECLPKGKAIVDIKDAFNYLKSHLQREYHEIFAVLFLDSQHRVLQFEKLFQGTINVTYIHPREVIKRALHHNAAAIIAAHNHPSGATEPSLADIEMTKQLTKALSLVEVRLLDHIIIGDEVFSFNQNGLL